ncbi:MAG: hypothetical protein AAF804_20945, partial [Bacteroidota bacterium]
MKKIDQATLVDYLYGELDPEQAQAVEAYLDQHPELRQELGEMAGVRSFLADGRQEAELPPLELSLGEAKVVKPLWSRVWFQALAAAIVLLFLIAGLDLRVSWQPGQVQ